MTAGNEAWSRELEHELKDNILAYWMNHTVDEATGGFYGEVSADNEARKDADRSLVLVTRILWTYATAYRFFKDERYRSMADRAYAYLNERFLDRENGGLFWMVGADGRPVQDKKQVYGQAFAMYAFSEYNRATGHPEALEQAIELFRLLDRHAYDPVHKGYCEALTRDWQPLRDFILSHHGSNAEKTMNTHLHVMEALTNLYRVWPDAALAARLGELIELTADTIVDNETYTFIQYFDRDWTSQSPNVSFGHDIEGSWLLVEAAEVLGDERLLVHAKTVGLRMAAATLERGTDKDGAVWNESDGSALIDTRKDWWPQAEAMVGFYSAYQLGGERRFLDAAKLTWHFIDTRLTDKTHGEWYLSLNEQGELLNGTKVSAWKCPYHNSRACFEMIERLGHGA